MIRYLAGSNSFMYVLLSFCNWAVLHLFSRAHGAGHNPSVVMFCLLGAVLVISTAVFFTRWDSRWILMLILVSVPVDLRADIAGTFTVSLSEWLLVPALSAWGMRLACSKKMPSFRPGPAIPLMLFMALIGASFCRMQELSASLKWTVRWLEVFLVYSMIGDADMDESDARFVLNGLIAAGIFLSATGVFQFVQHAGHTYKTVRSIFSHHNAFGEYLALTAPLMFPLVKEKRVYAAGLLLLFLGICVSGSRGAMLGFLAAMMVFTFIDRTWIINRRSMVFMLILGAVFAAVILPQRDLRNRWKRIFTDPAAASERRFKHYEESLRVIKKYPAGVGIGNLRHDWNRTWAHEGAGPHNVYLYVTIELGIAGLIVFVWWLGAHLMYVGKRVPSARGNGPNYLLAGMLCACVSFIVFNLFDDFFNNNMGIACGAVMGWGVCLADSAEKKASEHGKKH